MQTSFMILGNLVILSEKVTEIPNMQEHTTKMEVKQKLI